MIYQKSIIIQTYSEMIDIDSKIIIITEHILITQKKHTMDRYLNSMLPLLRFSKTRLRDIEVWNNVSSEDTFHYYEWVLYDSIKCKRPVLEEKIDGIVVKYDPTTNQIFVPDLIDQTVETLSSIYLTVKFRKKHGREWSLPFFY